MECIIREVTTNNWITIVITISMLLLAIVKVLYPIGFLDFMMLLTTDKYFITHQKTNKLSSPFTATLILVQAIAIALLLFLCIRIFEVQMLATDLMLFFQILMGYLVVLCSKLLIDKIIASIFSIEDSIEKYLFYKITYRNFIGVILLPIIVLCVYTISPTPIILMCVLCFMGLFNLIILFSVFKKNEKIILNNLYYFILYLCALEIAPYFILYKLIT